MLNYFRIAVTFSVCLNFESEAIIEKTWCKTNP